MSCRPIVHEKAEIGEAGDVHGWVEASRCVGVEKIREASTRILEPKLIDLVITQGPGVLRSDGKVSIGLPGSAGVSVLTKWLILAADFNAGNCAGADIAAQHDPVIVVQVVVETERVQTRALEHWKVPPLRGQRLEGCGSRNAWSRGSAGSWEASPTREKAAR